VDVVAGDLNRELGSYPGPSHRISDCCQVIRCLNTASDQVVAAPPKGTGASLVVRFALPR